MPNRHFAYIVTIRNSSGRVVDTVRGMSVVTDDARSPREICEAIARGLPGHLRQVGYSHNVGLTEVP